jgi:hypothetical protein
LLGQEITALLSAFLSPFLLLFFPSLLLLIAFKFCSWRCLGFPALCVFAPVGWQVKVTLRLTVSQSVLVSIRFSLSVTASSRWGDLSDERTDPSFVGWQNWESYIWPARSNPTTPFVLWIFSPSSPLYHQQICC